LAGLPIKSNKYYISIYYIKGIILDYIYIKKTKTTKNKNKNKKQKQKQKTKNKTKQLTV
jgi:hypothetical protein